MQWPAPGQVPMRGDLVTVGSLARRDRAAALARLRRDPRANLFLIDLVHHLARLPASGELRSEVVAAWQGGAIRGVAALRPTVVLDAELEPALLEVFLPRLVALPAGLVRSPAGLVGPLWAGLAGRGRRAIVDRTETAFLVERDQVACVDPPAGVRLRRAAPRDLDALVVAARASLQEEGRPDPFEGDPRGFRQWVHGRVRRAVVAEQAGRIHFVAYADVRRREGWLLQGVYTWPEARRRGLAAAGVSALSRDAFGAGADHVQLSVVDGNEAGVGLYRKLGFRAFAALRTILFV